MLIKSGKYCLNASEQSSRFITVQRLLILNFIGNRQGFFKCGTYTAIFFL